MCVCVHARAHTHTLTLTHAHAHARAHTHTHTHTQQLNLRLESIRTHCETLGYGSEVGPSDMNVHEHAQKITKKCNSSLAASGRYIYATMLLPMTVLSDSKCHCFSLFSIIVCSEVKDSGLLKLIAQLTGLLLQVEVRGSRNGFV